METAILLALQSVRFEGLTQLMALISALGNKAFVWLLLAVIMLFFAEKRETGVLVIAAVAVVFVVSEVLLEDLVSRVRPCDAGIGVTAVMGVSHNGFSFPSGHATSSFAAAMVIALMLGKKYGTPAIIGACLIAFSRLFLGVHYPTDVLAGALIGIVIAIAVVWVYRLFVMQAVQDRFNSRSQNARKSISSRRHKK